MRLLFYTFACYSLVVVAHVDEDSVSSRNNGRVIQEVATTLAPISVPSVTLAPVAKAIVPVPVVDHPVTKIPVAAAAVTAAPVVPVTRAPAAVVATKAPSTAAPMAVIPKPKTLAPITAAPTMLAVPPPTLAPALAVPHPTIAPVTAAPVIHTRAPVVASTTSRAPTVRPKATNNPIVDMTTTAAPSEAVPALPISSTTTISSEHAKQPKRNGDDDELKERSKPREKDAQSFEGDDDSLFRFSTDDESDQKEDPDLRDDEHPWSSRTPNEMAALAKVEADNIMHDKYIPFVATTICLVSFCFLLLVVQQMVENPQGCLAKLCRCTVALVRILCWPIRLVCCCRTDCGGGRPDRHTHQRLDDTENETTCNRTMEIA